MEVSGLSGDSRGLADQPSGARVGAFDIYTTEEWSNAFMDLSTEIDDQTLALLVTLSELTGQNHDIPHIVSKYADAVEQVREFRKIKPPPFKYQGF
jgi:hypothetical protein